MGQVGTKMDWCADFNHWMAQVTQPLPSLTQQEP